MAQFRVDVSVRERIVERLIMSMPEAFVPMIPHDEPRAAHVFSRLAALAPRATQWLIDKALPHGRMETRIIGLVGIGIVLFIGAFSTVMLREIDSFGRSSSEKHIKQLVKTVTGQLGTTLYMMDQAMRYAGDQVGMHNDPGKLSELGAAGQMPINRLMDFFFVDLDGRVVLAADPNDNGRTGLDVSNREYFRVHIGSRSLDSHIGRVFISRITGQRLIPLSRVVRRSNSEPMGVMVAIISVSDLHSIWQDIGLRPDDTLDLIGADGTPWLRWPIVQEAGAGTVNEPDHNGVAWAERVSGWPLQVVGAVSGDVIAKETATVRQVVIFSALSGGLLVAAFGLMLAKRTRQAVRERDVAAAERSTASKARDLLQETIDTLPAGVVLYDSENRLVLFNSLAASISPVLSLPGSTGKTYATFVRENAKTREAAGLGNQDEWVADQLDRFHNKGRRGLRQLADGRWVEMFEQSTPSGGTVGVRIDITDSKNLEIEAQRARDVADAMRARLTAAIDAIPVEFVEFDRDRRMILANRAARESQGWTGDPVGKTQRELLAESLVASDSHDGTGIFANGSPEQDAWIDQHAATLETTGTFDAARRNGECGRFYVNDMPDGGRVLVRVDITEMKRREAKLAAEMERLNSLLQSTGALVLMLDPDGRIVLANRALLDVFSMTGEEANGRLFSELPFTGFKAEKVEQWHADVASWRNAAPGERLQPAEIECSHASADGENRIFRMTANPVQDEEARLRYIVVIGVDDTERRQAEIRLFDASRLSNLGEMATGIAHEINQPLAVIRLAAESLSAELEMAEASAMAPELAEFVRQKLDRISNQTERASGIVRDLRTVARKPSNDAKPFDLAEASRVAGDLLLQQLKSARVEFTLDVPTQGPMVLGEASRLQQVMINLVLNARDALIERPDLPSVGTLGCIALTVAAASDGKATFTVEDDGPGIPKHILPRLFEPFFTTKPTGKGTGLGLSISYDIVKRMGGEIVADNRPEGGARFRITLPAQTS